MKKSLIFSVLLLIAISLSSCWTTSYVTVTDKPSEYQGNRYKKMVGMTKSQIIQAMGDVPEKSMSDGGTGEIMVYENRSLVTNSSASSSTTSRTASAAVAGYNIYGNPAAVGASQTNTNYGYSSNTTTQEHKAYVNFFIDSNNKCYNVQTNIGDIYSPAETHQECVKTASVIPVILSMVPPLTIVPGIPVLIWYLRNKDKVKPCY